MPQNTGQGFGIYTAGQGVGGESVPLRYNYDKPEKPRRIKGFEVFSLIFSSFSKPKNHTEISLKKICCFFGCPFGIFEICPY